MKEFDRKILVQVAYKGAIELLAASKITKKDFEKTIKEHTRLMGELGGLLEPKPAETRDRITDKQKEFALSKLRTSTVSPERYEALVREIESGEVYWEKLIDYLEMNQGEPINPTQKDIQDKLDKVVS